MTLSVYPYQGYNCATISREIVLEIHVPLFECKYGGISDLWAGVGRASTHMTNKY